MFIQTMSTPNPAVLKFLPGCEVIGDASPLDFPSPASAERVPLAHALFALDHVISVFFGRDFIAITKNSDGDWQLMRPSLLTTMMEHFVSGVPIVCPPDVSPSETPRVPSDADPEMAQIIAQIEEILDTRIRPAVAQDGGDIVFHSFEDGVVSLYMRGACAGCPSSTATLKNGIENLLRHYIPAVREVRATL